MTHREVQAVFPHRCAHEGCAVCAWVRRRVPLDERSGPPERLPRVSVATCQICGEYRIPNDAGKLPPHRCAA
jgi:hypothetical protein